MDFADSSARCINHTTFLRVSRHPKGKVRKIWLFFFFFPSANIRGEMKTVFNAGSTNPSTEHFLVTASPFFLFSFFFPSDLFILLDCQDFLMSKRSSVINILA